MSHEPGSCIESDATPCHSHPFDRSSENVSDAVPGLNDALCIGFALELTAQAKDLHVDAAVEDVLVHVRGLEEVRAAERAPRGIEKGNQQGALAFGQGHRSADRVGEHASLAVKLPAAEAKAARLG